MGVVDLRSVPDSATEPTNEEVTTPAPSIRRRVSPIPLHFTPTSASWPNLVEAFFSIITRQALRRGNFPTVADLNAAIERFIAAWNDRCRPFTWTKDPATPSSPRPPTRDTARQQRRQIRST